MTKKSSPFVWYDLMTTDVKGATAFYAKVIGWNIADSGMPGMTYLSLSAGDVMVGGIMGVPDGSGFTPTWSGYIHSRDVDADAKRVTKLGGKICKEPADIPGVGRFAAVADPGGAMFYLFKPNSGEGPKPVPRGTPGHIGWRELHAADQKKAWKFYSSLFGWTKGDGIDMGPMGTYQIFNIADDMAGGMMPKAKEMPQATWRYYFNVDAIDAALGRVKAAGGKAMSDPMQVPGGSWIAQGKDPQGASFAMVSPKR